MSHSSPSSSPVTRRELLAAGALAAGAAMLNAPAQSAPPPQRVLRIAHFTDVHVQPERKADQGLAAALRHMQALPDKPDVVFNGGDTIMDSFARDEARTRLQWDLWKRVTRDECGLPIENCIGNHDIWGWNKKESGTTGGEQRWGKKWAMEQFGIERPYRSFDRAGWHFIVLDSTFPKDDGYTARLDDEQFEWLQGHLPTVDPKTPILVLSHIPILSAASFFDGDCEKSGDWKVPGSWMHIDARRIKDLFLKHPNVKVALSGHLHLVDRVDYLGVTYFCNGAVSGGWWKGANYECEPGYALVDLYADGSAQRQYVTYGWVAQPE